VPQTLRSKICRPAGAFQQKISRNPHVFHFPQKYAGFLQLSEWFSAETRRFFAENAKKHFG